MRSLVRTRRVRALEERYLPKEELEVSYELVFLEDGEEVEEEEGVEWVELFGEDKGHGRMSAYGCD